MQKLLPLILSLFVSYAHAEALLDWTRAEDRRTISASLVSVSDEGKVKLKLENGKIAEIEVSVLIPEHKARLDELEQSAVETEEISSKPTMESISPKDGSSKIHIYKPALYLSEEGEMKNRPIAFLYSAGGKSLSVVKRLQSAADELGWVLVGVDAYSNAKSKKNRSAVMADSRKAFEWAAENLVFDSDKIVFGGMSGGAWWSYMSASELTQDAAGILAFGGWTSNMYDKDYSRKMAVALVNGNGDKGAITYEKKDTDFLEKRTKATVEKFRFPGGHILAPSEKALEAARWIHETKEF